MSLALYMDARYFVVGFSSRRDAISFTSAGKCFSAMPQITSSSTVSYQWTSSSNFFVATVINKLARGKDCFAKIRVADRTFSHQVHAGLKQFVLLFRQLLTFDCTPRSLNYSPCLRDWIDRIPS